MAGSSRYPCEPVVASIGRRAVAYAIDDILISAIFVFLLWEHISLASNAEQIAAVINGAWLWIAITQIIYHTWFVWQFGASLGKMAMGMRIVDETTFESPNFGKSLNRALFRIFSGMVFYLGFAWSLLDPMRKTWHDKTASTLVVNA